MGAGVVDKQAGASFDPVAASPSHPSDDFIDRRFAAGRTPALLTGVQALGRLLVEQRHRDQRLGSNTGIFVSGYQGSPLGGFDRMLGAIPGLRSEHDITLVQGVNEELAATSVWGSQLEVPGRTFTRDGVVGIWYGKAPGLDRAADAMRHANFLGVHPRGGVLALVGDDPACKSSTLPSASEATLSALNMPVLYPRNSEEVIRFGLMGVALSRASGSWVALKMVTDVADGTTTVTSDLDDLEIVVPVIDWDGKRWTYEQHRLAINPNSLRAEEDLFGPRAAMTHAFIAANAFSAIPVNPRAAWLTIVAAGTVYDRAREALSQLGLDGDELMAAGIRVLRIGCISPLDKDLVRRAAAGSVQVLVLEEKLPFLEPLLRNALYGMPNAPSILGKTDGRGQVLVPAAGELTTHRLLGPLRRVIGERVPLRVTRSVASQSLTLLPLHRTAYFCSGCPHNRSTVIPEGSLVGAGIGCAAMTVQMPHTETTIISLTQMGGEGAQWIGQAPYTEMPHIFQNVGDGTYFHSGQLAVQAAIAAGVNITYKILYNSAVAMTGGQDAQGSLPVLNLVQKLHAEGVGKIIVCSDEPRKYGRRAKWPHGTQVWHRDRVEEAQDVLKDTSGVTVLVYDQRCAAESRRLRKRGILPAPPTTLVINERVCEGCGDCGRQSNCLSLEPIETEFGRKTRINQTSCNTDLSCLLGDCPSFVSIDTARSRPRRKTVLEAPDVPEPVRPEPRTAQGILITGIGGTGVVTVNQVLATAAAMEGWDVHALDQTGLSQKAGPVSSHLRLSREAHESSNRIGPQEADVHLACDVLVGAEDYTLSLSSASTTLTVVSTSQTPTGAMVWDPGVDWPDQEDLLDRIRSRSARIHEFDALGIAESLFGRSTEANLLLVGAAYQAGGFDLPAAAIERAIVLNGVAVEANIAAFRWGRVIVDQPSLVPGLLRDKPADTGSPVTFVDIDDLAGETRRIVEVRFPELVAYQGTKCAEEYVAAVRRAWNAERCVTEQTEFSSAVARGIHHLTAYKDEYEVARLLTSPEFEAGLRREYPDSPRARYNLSPPLLRSFGLKGKIELSSRWRPVLRMMARARFVRGTPLDVFGYARIRRVERQLAVEYKGMVDFLSINLNDDNYDRSVLVAAAAELVRGYENVKLANVEVYRDTLRSLDAA